jgi:hypothetical protein
MKYKLELIVSIVISCSQLFSQDRNFSRVYQSSVLTKGIREIEVFNDYNAGRTYHYRELKNRLEFENGLSNRLQTSLYINVDQRFQEQPVGTMLSIEKSVPEISFSNEWKYKLSDAVANTIGAALYGEITLKGDEIELETKIILDKRFDKHIMAFNFVNEFEVETQFENNKLIRETAIPFELNAGYMYSISNSLGLGLEMVNNYKLEEGEILYSVLTVGPSISYAGEKWWAIFNIQPQIIDFKAGVRELNDHTKVECRLLISFEL